MYCDNRLILQKEKKNQFDGFHSEQNCSARGPGIRKCLSLILTRLSKQDVVMPKGFWIHSQVHKVLKFY